MRNSKSLTAQSLTAARKSSRINAIKHKRKLIDNQVVLTLPRAPSLLSRLVGGFSSLVLGLLVVAAIAVVTVWQYEAHFPRINIVVPVHVLQKACGVPV